MGSNMVSPTTPEQALEFARRALRSGKLQAATALSGGYLNHVFRVSGPDAASVVVKHAPPHVASNKDIALDQERILFEARALTWLAVQPWRCAACRAPQLLLTDKVGKTVVMEDVGSDAVDLAAVLAAPDAGAAVDEAALGRHLGCFIGDLHAQTYHKTQLRGDFTNTSVQVTRQAVLYDQVASWLSGYPDCCECLGLAKGSPDDVVRQAVSRLCRRVQRLGALLAEPDSGVCLTMGDLWFPSILVTASRTELRLIDWEFAHYGQPLQDIGHLAAHMHIQATRATSDAQGRFQRAWDAFFVEYCARSKHSKQPVWTLTQAADARQHMAAEILQRSIGGFVMPDLAPEHIKTLVQDAVHLMQWDPASDQPVRSRFAPTF